VLWLQPLGLEKVREKKVSLKKAFEHRHSCKKKNLKTFENIGFVNEKVYSKSPALVKT